jgi:ribosomal protein L30E
VEEGKVMALRVKQMSKQEFANVAERQWVPVVLSGEACPRWMRGIPQKIVRLVLASGIFNDPRVIEERGVTYSGLVGGIDIYRYDQNDESLGYPINKDHYVIILDQDNDDALLVHGPLRDHEHWISQLPDLPEGIVVIDSLED